VIRIWGRWEGKGKRKEWKKMEVISLSQIEGEPGNKNKPAGRPFQQASSCSSALVPWQAIVPLKLHTAGGNDYLRHDVRTDLGRLLRAMAKLARQTELFQRCASARRQSRLGGQPFLPPGQ